MFCCFLTFKSMQTEPDCVLSQTPNTKQSCNAQTFSLYRLALIHVLIQTHWLQSWERSLGAFRCAFCEILNPAWGSVFKPLNALTCSFLWRPPAHTVWTPRTSSCWSCPWGRRTRTWTECSSPETGRCPTASSLGKKTNKKMMPLFFTSAPGGRTSEFSVLLYR